MEKTLKEKVDELENILSNVDEKQIKKAVKKMKLGKAKVSKGRMKKGWVGVLFVNPNKVIRGEKTQLDGGTYKTKDGGYHVTDGHEIVWWEGKFPILWQRYDKLNPTNLFPQEGDIDEIYGQDLVMLRMKRDLIKEKKKGGSWGILYIILILVAGAVAVNYFFPNILGG